MDKKMFRKRFSIGIALVAAIAIMATIITSTAIYIPKNKTATEKQNTNKGNQPQERKDLKGVAQYGAVETKENVVSSNVVVPTGSNDQDAMRLGQEYADTLGKKYPGKTIEVRVVDTNKKDTIAAITQNYNLYEGTAGNVPNNAVPRAVVTIGKGVLDFDRYVEVTLDTTTPEKYNVSILGKQLKYVTEKKIFHQVIQETDEEKIRSNIKVELAK